ncbi:Highly reducing polyketide synthase FUM1 [Fusarium oxysporum f. sp. raphani]|uniref:Highly reducing polyketide synthase FUM1 n=1 Tax=Fusarium oxysporum f. sp. raphani TaxID=96318 RepID=A0A8J5NDX6_FUSOX|nr:Highly reducing polyketide synthase FUM1 [Fusarium oxysporum f. sp. raphani]
MGVIESPRSTAVNSAEEIPQAIHNHEDSVLPVAIVGMGMRLPGGIHTPDDLWKILAGKRSTRCEIPSTRFSVDGFHSPNSKPGSIAMRHGHFLDDKDDLHRLDTSFFSMGMTEVSDIDPQQRMLLEVAYECMQSSGQTKWRGSNIGCYVGVWGEDWLDLHSKDLYDSGTYRVSGGHDFAISNRISYEYDLKGPSFTIKAGCSSSLIALHEAVRAIRAGDCDGAIVAGTNLIFSPTMSMAMTEQGVLSPDASCKTFDANANGYARGEAINAIFLKPLDNALRDGDPIRDPKDTCFVEAHGTGTSVGDPLEATAIARVFGGSPDRKLYIGSVKPNLGHSEGASGVSSVMKAILALENRTIPPNINFSTPNPKIPFSEMNMAVPVDAIPWPQNRPLRVSVNSFGIGGANAHCIIETLEEYLGGSFSNRRQVPPTQNGNGSSDANRSSAVTSITSMKMDVLSKKRQSAVETARQVSTLRFSADNAKIRSSKALYVLSAANPMSLRQSVIDYQEYLGSHKTDPVDVSYTLCNRREHLSHRTYGVATTESTNDTYIVPGFSPLSKTNNNTPPEINLIFTGQGAQWAGMGKELMDEYETFYNTIAYLGLVLSELEHPPTWDLIQELSRPEESSNVGRAEFSQPLVCAVQVALVDLLRSWGIVPAAVVGHSSGEVAAAYAAGAISSEEAITIAYYRGYVNQQYTRDGGMAAIGMGAQEVTPYLVEGVTVACENSPQSVTLSGDKGALGEICQKIKDQVPDCFIRQLKVNIAYHSHHIQDLGGLFETLLKDKVYSQAPSIPFFSSVSVQQITEPRSLDAAYWRENLERPVRFTGAVKLLLETRAKAASKQVFVEIGPHSALAGPLRQIFKAHGKGKEAYASAMIRGQDCTESVLQLAGELFCHGSSLQLSNITADGDVVVDLPPYPWNHDKEYWSESRVSKDWRFRKFPNHELLGSRTLESSGLQPEWRNVIRLDKIQWLRDHQVLNDVVFPCAGYLAMAVEAVRQVAGSLETEGFTLKSVVVQSALVITESKPVEMLTSLRRVRLTNTLDSAWWEFCIVAHNGTSWTKHCEGQVRPGQDAHQKIAILPQSQPIGKYYPRLVDNLYPELLRIGLRYGPSFRGLENVSCVPNGKKAAATLHETTVSESSYAIHPTTIDHCLQLFFPASCDGTFYRAEKLCVPTAIGRLYLADGKLWEVESARAEASAATNPGGSISGAATVVSKHNSTLLSLEDGKFSPLEMDLGEDGNADLVGAARLEWKPNLDFADMHSLVRPSHASMDDGPELDLVERLTLLAILEIHERIDGVVIPEDHAHQHMLSFRGWIADQATAAAEGKYLGMVADPRETASLEREARVSLMTKLRQQVLQTGAASAAVLIGRVVDHCEEIVKGELEGIELLQAEDGLTNYYNYVESRTDSIDFFATAGHTRPTLRVLEIGAGTGGGAQVILEGLTNGKERLYSTYAYTDISAGFFVAARERFKAYKGLDFRVLDITKDPVEQGFEPGSFDLIIAGNVIHATPSLNETLANVRKLLAPEGYFFLQELSPKMRMVNLIMGTLPGWWLGAAEGRAQEPYLAPPQWDIVLKTAGFSGVDAAIYDAPYPYHLNANIISRPAKELASQPRAAKGRLTLLHHPGDMDSSSITQLRNVLGARGLETNMVALQEHEQPKAGDQDIIISLLELEKPFFSSISAAQLESFQRVVAGLGSTEMIWITRPAQHGLSASDDPGFGLSLGLARTLRSEQSLAITIVEIDQVNDASIKAVLGLVINVLDHRADGTEPTRGATTMDPDREYVVHNGDVKVARYHPVSLSKELASRASKPEAVTLEIGRMGLLQTLGWVPFPTSDPGYGEVTIEPRCAGLNFRDVLLCMGVVEATSVGIGLEGSGIITKVGAGVSSLQPGDRVFYLADNCFSTQITISAQRCAKIPSQLAFEDAATMPCVYATIVHSLLDVGGLRSGQSVLIHSACGGIGIAALNLCRNIEGLEIYTTVGNEEKVQYLVDNFGLPRSRIFNSRDASFLYDIRAATQGRGVDLVLNSLSGELLHASWQCVAPYGKMLEIGKRDFIGKARLEMDLFEANRSFIGIDLARFDSARCQKLLERTAAMIETDSIQPIKPVKVFNASDAEGAFRYMQKGVHLGKIVVSIPPQSSTLLPVTPKPLQVKLNAESSYLLVGGLGGLGRAAATWMVERGARYLIFFSRSAGLSARDKAFFQELASQGCTAQAVQGDVMNLADVEHAMASAPPGRPIRGVLQMSMVLRDKPFVDMSLEDWDTAVKPKVHGTWNLHLAAPKDLDFFFATGSISGSFGTPGQANYAAGNTYLTALFEHRRALGLPASVLQIGLIEDIGYLAQNPERAEALRAAGGFFLRTRQLLEGLNWALLSSEPQYPEYQLTIGLRSDKSLSDPANRVIWKKDSRAALYHNQEISTDAGAGDDQSLNAIRLLLASSEEDPAILEDPATVELVTNEIGKRVCMFMLRPVEEMDPTASLTSLGVDSLVTIEIRNWIKRTFGGVEVSTLEILNSGTIEGLARLTLDGLKARFVATGKNDGDAYLEMKAP